MSAVGVIAAAMIAAPPLDAGEILVPDNFATIGEAIAASTAGDTILVGPGVYSESIVLAEGAGDGVVLRSTNGPLETTIAYAEVAAVNEAVVVFQRCSSATQLAGFTIDGRGAAKRGVLANSESRPALADLVIEGADHGIASHRGSCPVLQDVRVRKCAVAGLFVRDSSADAQGCSFAEGEKFGAYIRGTTEPVRLRACRFAGNALVGVQAIEGELVLAGGEVVDNGNTGLLLRAVSPEISDAVVARNANVGIVMESSSAVIRRCTVSENGFGVVVSIAGEPKILGCTFEGNRSYHVGVEGDANPTIGGSLENANRFLGGASLAVQSSSSREVVATHNYWGQPCVPEELLRVTGGRLLVEPWASPDLGRTFDDCDEARNGG
ncbi:MAG: right-handed parallel beta-helix repeat-containing protein [bacterium]